MFAVGAAVSIPTADIDHDRARRGVASGQAGGLRVLLGNRRSRVCAVFAMVFDFANACLPPLGGHKLATAHPAYATALMSACIIATQSIMLSIALAVGRYAARIGRHPILLPDFPALRVRGVLYTVSDDTAWLIGLQR